MTLLPRPTHFVMTTVAAISTKRRWTQTQGVRRDHRQRLLVRTRGMANVTLCKAIVSAGLGG